MRYWVYKDARIVGPMSPEEVSHLEGADSNLLLCPEGTDGSRESDWKTAGEVPDLESLLPQAQATVSPLEAAEFETWSAREFFLDEFLEPPQLRSWAPSASRPVRQPDDSETHPRRNPELDAKLGELEEKLSKHERQQEEILERLAEKDLRLQEREKEIQLLQKQLEQSRLPREEIGLSPAPTPSSAVPIEISAPIETTVPVETKPKILEIPKAIPLTTKTYEPLSVSSFAPPIPTPTPAPEPAAAPPEPSLPEVLTYSSFPTPLPQTSSEPSGYTPMPSDIQTPDPFSLPRTMVGTFESPAKAADSPVVPPAAYTPLEELTRPGPALLQEPVNAPSADAPKHSRTKKLWIIAGVALLGAILGSFYLMKGTKVADVPEQPALEQPASNVPSPAAGLTTPVSTVPSQAAMGTALQAQNAQVTQPTITANPAASSPMPAAQNVQPSTPSRDFVADRSQEAIDLVKNYSLDSARGSIAAWLQYSFLAPGSQEKWSANPGESAGSYYVQYQVTPGSQASKKIEPMVYVFEVEVDQKSVKGFNAAAKELLAGETPKKVNVPQKAASKRKPRKHRALKPGQIPLLPLPPDSALPHSHNKVDEDY